MSEFDTRAYHRELALYCLHLQKQPATAGELAEHMLALAQHEGLPKVVQAATNPPAVAGILRALKHEGLARQDGERPNGRNGRAEPAWTFTGAREKRQMPHPALFELRGDFTPGTRPMDAFHVPPPADPYAGMNKPQILVLLAIGDDLGAACSRFLRDLEDVRARARRALAEVGLETTE